MRYWHPFTEEALLEAADLHPAKLVALSLYPHYSRAVGGSSVGELNRCLRRRPLGCPVRVVDHFQRHPLFLKAHGDRIAAALAGFPGGGVGPEGFTILPMRVGSTELRSGPGIF